MSFCRSGYTFQYFNMSKFINEIVNANVPVLLYYGDADLVSLLFLMTNDDNYQLFIFYFPGL